MPADRAPDVELQAQACKRCYSRKRKCDRKQPRCGACTRADTLCEVEIRTVDRDILQQINETRAANTELQRRIAELESSLHRLQGSGPNQLFNEEAASTSTVGHAKTTNTLVSIASGILHINSSYPPTPLPTGIRSLSDARDGYSFPTLAKASSMGTACLASHKQVWQCVEPDVLQADINRMYEPDGLVNPEYAESRFRVMMLLHLELWGTDAGPKSDVESPDECHYLYRQLALNELPGLMEREDLISIQALILVSLMSIHASGGPSLSHLVGIASRTALALGINRRDNIYLPTIAHGMDETSIQRHNEFRKNIFWGIYSLDRLTMFTLSKPPTIRDEDIDVDFPSISLNQDSTFMSDVAIRCQTLQGRRLFGIIQEKLYGISVTASGSLEEGESLVQDLVAQVQAWYQASPLKQAFAPISDAAVHSQLLDDTRYHQMMIALHRPSPLIPVVSSPFLITLRQSAQYSVDLYWHYSTNKRLHINWVHLYHIFTSATSLVYCFCEHQSRPELQHIEKGEIDKWVKKCKDLLERYSGGWSEARRYLDMFNILAHPFTAPVQSATHFGMSHEPVDTVQPTTHFPISDTIDTAIGLQQESAQEDPLLTLYEGASLDDLNEDFLSSFLSSDSASQVMRGFWSDNSFGNT